MTDQNYFFIDSDDAHLKTLEISQVFLDSLEKTLTNHKITSENLRMSLEDNLKVIPLFLQFMESEIPLNLTTKKTCLLNACSFVLEKGASDTYLKNTRGLHKTFQEAVSQAKEQDNQAGEELKKLLAIKSRGTMPDFFRAHQISLMKDKESRMSVAINTTEAVLDVQEINDLVDYFLKEVITRGIHVASLLSDALSYSFNSEEKAEEMLKHMTENDRIIIQKQESDITLHRMKIEMELQSQQLEMHRQVIEQKRQAQDVLDNALGEFFTEAPATSLSNDEIKKRLKDKQEVSQRFRARMM